MAFFRFGVLVVFLCFGCTLLCSAEDALIFTSVPTSITFNSKDTIPSSKVCDVFSAILSYTLPEPFDWQSLDPPNPMKRPAAICVLDIVGVNPDVQLNIQGEKFILENQNDLDSQYTKLASRTKKRYGNQSVLAWVDTEDELYELKADNPELFSMMPADSEGRLEKVKEDPDLGRALQEGTFNMSLAPDRALMLELVTVKLLNKDVSKNKEALNNGFPDIFWVKMSAMAPLMEEYGDDSIQVKEATRMMEQTCMEFQTTFENVYHNQAVMAVLIESSISYGLTRKSRSLLQDKTTQTEPPKIVFMSNYSAYEFQDDFHVAFSLTAFTSVLLILTVLGVSVGMWFMDPGRDSIIYRMTSQRKKD